jgi:hypothetical protein
MAQAKATQDMVQLMLSVKWVLILRLDRWVQMILVRMKNCGERRLMRTILLLFVEVDIN